MPYADPEVRRETNRLYSARHRAANRAARDEASRRSMERRRAEVRAAVFAHYGDRCARCGAVDDLTLDHVNDDGNRQRAELKAAGLAAGKGGWQFYAWLVANNFPDVYALQTLCWPCQRAKRYGR